MNLYRRFLVVCAAVIFPRWACAHPGHDHGDIPAVIRHPFAGADHLLIAAAVFFVMGATIIIGARWLAAVRYPRWIGATLVVAGVGLTLI